MSPRACLFCWNDGRKVPAEFVAAQSEDAGETVDWVLICNGHRQGWNDGGDWRAPIYRLGEEVGDASGVNDALGAEPKRLRDESTSEGRKIWAAVDRAAARAPRWLREHMEKKLDAKEGEDGPN